MTHQSVKQNDATQWVQRFYEVVFECFFLNIKGRLDFKIYRYLSKIAPTNMHLIHCGSPVF